MRKTTLLFAITTSLSMLPSLASAANSVNSSCVTPKASGYDQIGCLHDGLAGVIKTIKTKAGPVEKVGYIDKKGKLVIPMVYDVEYTGDGGEESTFYDFSEGLALVKKNDSFGFIDTQGNVVIPLKYWSAKSFTEGLAPVSISYTENNESKWGAIDKNGKIIIPFEYEDLDNFKGGLATAREYNNEEYGKAGVINKKNETVIPFAYDEVGELSEGLLAASKDSKWGYIDISNNVVIPFTAKYHHANAFSNGLAAVFGSQADSDYTFGYIDKKGKLVIPIKHQLPYMTSLDEANFKNGIATVYDINESKFCINLKGAKVKCPK